MSKNSTTTTKSSSKKESQDTQKKSKAKTKSKSAKDLRMPKGVPSVKYDSKTKVLALSKSIMLNGTRLSTDPQKVVLDGFSEKEIQLIVATAKVVNSFAVGHDVTAVPPSRDGEERTSIASKLLQHASKSSIDTPSSDDGSTRAKPETTNT